MKNYNEMADAVFSRRDEYALKKRESRKNFVKLSVSFTCMALVLFAGFGLWQKGKLENKPFKNPEVNEEQIESDSVVSGNNDQTVGDSIIVGEKDYYGPAEDTPYNNGPCIPQDGEEDDRRLNMIESYECGGSSAGACYALPKNGKYYFSIPLNAAFEAYGEMNEDTGERIVYRVVVRVFEDGKMITGKENFLEISDKFTRMGYKSAIEIPNNRDDLAVLTLHVTEEELKNFPEDKENGYFFFLYNEHDGMGDKRIDMPEESQKVIY